MRFFERPLFEISVDSSPRRCFCNAPLASEGSLRLGPHGQVPRSQRLPLRSIAQIVQHNLDALHKG